jgi:hypothetical protein
MNPLMKDLNRRLAGKQRPDSLKDVELSLGLPEQIDKDYRSALQIDTLLRRFVNAGKNPDVDKLVEQMNSINARLIKVLKADIQDAKASAGM